MAYQYELLDPIDFSQRNRASDAQATDVKRLKNAAYEDSPRGTMSFFAFYRPIIEQYVSEFARKNPFFPEEQEADLFWLTMRHAFALLRNYEWYLAHLDQFKGASGINHRVPWKQGILSLAKLFF